jgi:hypothetical protein
MQYFMYLSVYFVFSVFADNGQKSGQIKERVLGGYFIRYSTPTLPKTVQMYMRSSAKLLHPVQYAFQRRLAFRRLRA